MSGLSQEAFFQALFEETQAVQAACAEIVQPLLSAMPLKSGKHLRSIFAFHLGEALGGATREHMKLALSCELLHAATLIHDDVLDGADLRRNRPSVPFLFGNHMAVLGGDYLFAASLLKVAGLSEGALFEDYAALVLKLVEGEMIQLSRLQSGLIPSLEACLRSIHLKTGALFGFLSYGAAILSGVNPGEARSFKRFGEALGEAYQIQDDCLDYQDEETGKPPGQDFKEGKWTLPAVFAHEYSEKKDKGAFLDCFSGENRSLERVKAYLKRSQALKKAKALQEERIEAAFSNLPPHAVLEAPLRAAIRLMFRED